MNLEVKYLWKWVIVILTVKRRIELIKKPTISQLKSKGPWLLVMLWFSSIFYYKWPSTKNNKHLSFYKRNFSNETCNYTYNLYLYLLILSICFEKVLFIVPFFSIKDLPSWVDIFILERTLIILFPCQLSDPKKRTFDC